VLPDSHTRTQMSAEDGALDVLFEDEHLVIVNKPAGIVVHPTYRHTSGTLMNALLWHARESGWTGRPSIVGRLDKLTSGLVVAAKSPRMHAALQRQLLSLRSEKDYLAVVDARVTKARGPIDLRLARDPRDRRRVVASETAGVPSETRFERLGSAAAAGGVLSLVRCRLITGRMHQIRVHLAAQRWPIVGDPLYGKSGSLFGRQALHAWRLSFVHPVTRTSVQVIAPLPRDLGTLLESTGLNAFIPLVP
jgi:23S rRNA pseudouridine1911/1915/1917 synthase